MVKKCNIYCEEYLVVKKWIFDGNVFVEEGLWVWSIRGNVWEVCFYLYVYFFVKL